MYSREVKLFDSQEIRRRLTPDYLIAIYAAVLQSSAGLFGFRSPPCSIYRYFVLTGVPDRMHYACRVCARGRHQGMVIAAWTVRMAFPDLFSSAATAFLLLLTSLQLAVTLPLLKKAVVGALGACSCWWRHRPSEGRRSSSSSSRAPGRRRQ